MEPETRAPRPRAFALPNLAWVAAAVCAFAPLSGALSRAVQGRLTLPALGSAIAVAAAFVVVPTIAAFVVWRFSGRRPNPANTTFFLTITALGLVAVWHAVNANRERDAAMHTEARALATQLVQRAAGQNVTSPPAVARSATAVGAAAQAIIEAQRAVKARLDAVQLVYVDAEQALAPQTFFDLAPLGAADAIATRRQHVQAFADANALLHESATLGAFYFSSELRDRAVPEDAVRDAVAIYRTATKKQLPRVKRLRDKDGALALLMFQFLDFAESHRGQWHVELPAGTITFATPTAKARYEDIRRTAEVLHADRRQLQETLLAAAP